MLESYNVTLPSKPKIVSENGNSGMYEIANLYPGYGHTLGNSLRRIILSSIPGVAITTVKIAGTDHEFSTLAGVKEDVINIILNLKKIRFKTTTDEEQTVELSVKGAKDVTAGDIKVPGQVEVLNPTQHIATLTDKNAELKIEMKLRRGLGFVPKEVIQKDKVEIGNIALDAIFTPIRRVNYEVENMRVGDRTDFNRLRIVVETDGSLTPREALERSIETMIQQLKAVIGFREEQMPVESAHEERHGGDRGMADSEMLKTRITELALPARVEAALDAASIRTVGGLVRKREDDLLAIEGLGQKGLQDIKRSLSNLGLVLRTQ